MNAYLPLCEQYDSMAQGFFLQFQDVKKQNHPLLMVQTAICAVLFEALAVEAYVNLFGSVVLGEEKFFAEYESTTNKRFSTIDKIKKICNKELQHPYNTSDTHFQMLKALFTKRAKLVHNKPKTYHIQKQPLDYSNIQAQYADYIIAFNEEVGFIYTDIDKQMCLYNDLKANLTECREGKPEVLSEFQNNCAREIGQAIAEMFTEWQ